MESIFMRGNKGEWSEIYTFLKILGDGVIFGGDENLNKIDSIFYPVISIIREESSQYYFYEKDRTSIKIIDGNENSLIEVDANIFNKMSKELLTQLIQSIGRTFEFPVIEKFLKAIYITKIKSGSTHKRDITIMVHDLMTNTRPTLGFSIKSKLGGNSTLLNPGESTNFIFEILPKSGYKVDVNLRNIVNNIDSRSKIKDRVKYLLNNGFSLEFKNIESSNFQLNLQMIDTLLPNLIGEMLVYYYGGLGTSLSNLVSLLEENNPLDFNQKSNHKFYDYKVKNFLTDIALGMTPQREWTGLYDATGGYIIVKEDGDLVCYHIYNRNEFQTYLLNNTFFDTPSSGRYKFGEIYEEEGRLFFKLNLQIRFQ